MSDYACIWESRKLYTYVLGHGFILVILYGQLYINLLHPLSVQRQIPGDVQGAKNAIGNLLHRLYGSFVFTDDSLWLIVSYTLTNHTISVT